MAKNREKKKRKREEVLDEEPPMCSGFGTLKGKIKVGDDFDETPQEIIDAFYGCEDKESDESQAPCISGPMT
ncbi:MAG: hypothetical protein ACPG5T_06075 [Endozoicomonas sp.]